MSKNEVHPSKERPGESIVTTIVTMLGVWRQISVVPRSVASALWMENRCQSELPDLRQGRRCRILYSRLFPVSHIPASHPGEPHCG